MARKPRLEVAGASYHIMARGNERARIFHGVAEYSLFIETLQESLDRFGVGLHAWVLMPNHFHLAATTPRGNLSRWMAWLQTTFTVRYNRKRGRAGHLFQGRYWAELVDSDAYATTLVRYIHLNPIRRKAGGRREFVGGLQELKAYAWSGHLDLAGIRTKPLLPLDKGWQHYWGRSGTEAIRGYLRGMKLALGLEPESWSDVVQRGLVAGRPEFVDQASARLEKQKNRDAQIWRRPLEWEKVRKKMVTVLQKEKSRALKAWVRTRIFGEKAVEIAREMGYADGSGVCQAARRLEARGKQDKGLAKQMDNYRILSIVKN